MVDREKVIDDLEEQITWIRDNNFHKFPGWGHTVLAMRDALALLKAQEQEPIVPIRRSAHEQGVDDVWYECGKCGEFLGVNRYSKQFCANCGQAVKWDG